MLIEEQFGFRVVELARDLVYYIIRCCWYVDVGHSPIW